MQDSPDFQGGANLSKMWDTISYEFFDGWPSGRNPTQEETDLIEYFITRPKFQDLLEKFTQQNLDQIKKDMSYSNLTEIQVEESLFESKDEILSHLNLKETRRKLLPYLSRQFQAFEMILDVDWLGSEFGVYYETGFGTDMGICEWITPNTTFKKGLIEPFDLRSVQPGSQTGVKNGLTLMLDAEAFNYGLRLE